MFFRYLFAALLALPFIAPAEAQDGCYGRATAELSLSDVRAPLFNTGSLFNDGGAAAAPQKVPKDGDAGTVFWANLWVGGTVGGEVRTAASTFAAGGEAPEFFPGPLDDAGQPAQECPEADRIYRVTAVQLAAFEAGNPPAPELSAWPVGLGAPAVDAAGDPVVPTSLDQTVDLDAGERPVVYGTETAFWVMNDVAGEHLTTGSEPLGIEVRAFAFVVNAPGQPEVDRATFHRYEIVNKSGAAIEDLHAGLWTEYDLGTFNDDYIASDAGRHLSIVYNADEDDAGPTGYDVPPAAGVDVLSGGFSNLFYENRQNVPTGNPGNVPSDYYNLLRGLWLDGTPLTRGGLGYAPGETNVTRWHWDGDPVLQGFWTEENPTGDGVARASGDRRAVVSAQPVTLAPGATHTVDFAVLFAQGSSRLGSIGALRAASDVVQLRYDDGSLFDTTLGDLVVSEEDAPVSGALSLAVAPNPVRSSARVGVTLPAAGTARVRVLDALGRTVATLADGAYGAGDHAFDVPARLATGVYVVTVEAGGERATRTLTVVR